LLLWLHQELEGLPSISAEISFPRAGGFNASQPPAVLRVTKNHRRRTLRARFWAPHFLNKRMQLMTIHKDESRPLCLLACLLCEL
jgi:hypothetical protein